MLSIRPLVFLLLCLSCLLLLHVLFALSISCLVTVPTPCMIMQFPASSRWVTPGLRALAISAKLLNGFAYTKASG
jgi:hypothetical protein